MTAAAPGLMIVLCGAIVFVLGSKRPRENRSPRLMVAVVAAVSASVPAALVSAWVTPLRRFPSDPHLLAQSQAAVWISHHVPVDDDLATNSHCRTGRTRDHCDARTFWLSGFGQRRVLVGGWGISDPALRANGVAGYPSWNQPYHDPGLLKLNDDAFTDPSPSVIGRLYQQYKVRWLIADREAGPVSPDIARYARREYANRWIVIYRIDADAFAPSSAPT
ncbi:MAG: hypothetical protein ACRDP1_08815 [Nocardioidaceae bacterium]